LDRPLSGEEASPVHWVEEGEGKRRITLTWEFKRLVRRLGNCKMSCGSRKVIDDNKGNASGGPGQ